MLKVITFFITFLIGAYFGQNFPYWLGYILDQRYKRRLLKSIVPIPVDETRLCQGPHTWEDANSIDEQGEFTKIQICDVCGFIPSKNLMATEEGMRRTKINRKITEFEDRNKEVFIKLEERMLREDFEQELKNGVSFDKIIKTHLYGQTFNKRFTKYVVEMVKETNKPEQKSDV
jgi:hypothetical protein